MRLLSTTRTMVIEVRKHENNDKLLLSKRTMKNVVANMRTITKEIATINKVANQKNNGK